MADMYVGINGKARKIIKAYVGVNGVARAITAGYAGVGGVARSIFSGTTIAMPQKGDTITLNSADDANFSQYTFKVLSTSESVAKLLFLNMNTENVYNAPVYTKWCSTSTPGTAATLDLSYSSSLVYSALESSFYQQFLPPDIQYGVDDAIGANGMTLTQYIWQGSESVETNSYPLKIPEGNFYFVEMGAQESDLNLDHPIYPLSLYDIIQYLGVTTSMTMDDTTFTYRNIVNMLLPNGFESSDLPMDAYGVWLLDVKGDTEEILMIDQHGGIRGYTPTDERTVYPVMHIDLTNITWQTV